MGRPPPALQGPGRRSTLSPRPLLSGLLVKQHSFQTQTCHPSTRGHRRRCSLGLERVSVIPSNVPFCSQPKHPSSGDPSPGSQSRDISFLTCLLRISSFALEHESPLGITCSLSGFPTFTPGSHIRLSFVNAETVGPSGCFIAEAALQTDRRLSWACRPGCGEAQRKSKQPVLLSTAGGYQSGRRTLCSLPSPGVGGLPMPRSTKARSGPPGSFLPLLPSPANLLLKCFTQV